MNGGSWARNAWIILVIVWFGLVSLFSGTFEYIDGDDASSIAYHVLGRNEALQRPYSPYHGMMDKLLGLLPAQEPLLRSVGLGICRAANVLLVILTLALVFDWLGERGRKRSWTWYLLVTLAVLLAAPELSYLGLVYSPSLVAMTLVLGAHLLLRYFYQRRDSLVSGRLPAWAASLLLFGLGVSFRWNILAYGLVIVVDLLVSSSSPSFGNRLSRSLIWGVLAILVSLLMIGLSGYGPRDLLAALPRASYVINQAGTQAPGMVDSLKDILLNTGLTLSSLLTPALVLLTALGLLKILKDRNPLGWVVLAGLLGVLPWLRSGVPKFLIVCLPVLLFAYVLGLDFLSGIFRRQPGRNLVFAAVVLLLLFPWFIGVRIDREGTAWGPAFQRKPFDYREVEGTSFGLAVWSGMAYPTPEGPRPLYGHAYVLFGGDWKHFVVEDAVERRQALDKALETGLPLLVTSWSPDFFLDELYARGFQTADPKDRMTPDGKFVERRFTDAAGRSVTMFFHEIEAEDMTDLSASLSSTDLPRKVILIGYPKTLHIAFRNRPASLQPLGPKTAILDLQSLLSASTGLARLR